MDAKTDFKTNLRAELDHLDLTVKELSVRTGIPKGTLDCYLGARASMPPADIATRIADALGVTVEYLINGQEIKKQEQSLGYNYNIGTIIKILVELSERDLETILTLSRILRTQAAER